MNYLMKPTPRCRIRDLISREQTHIERGDYILFVYESAEWAFIRAHHDQGYMDLNFVAIQSEGVTNTVGYELYLDEEPVQRFDVAHAKKLIIDFFNEQKLKSCEKCVHKYTRTLTKRCDETYMEMPSENSTNIPNNE